MALPWNERVPMLSINPDVATREDVARMAAELMKTNHLLSQACIYVRAWADALVREGHGEACARSIRKMRDLACSVAAKKKF